MKTVLHVGPGHKQNGARLPPAFEPPEWREIRLDIDQALQAAGFQTIAGKRRARGLDLWLLASKGPMGEAEMRELAGKVLPG